MHRVKIIRLRRVFSSSVHIKNIELSKVVFSFESNNTLKKIVQRCTDPMNVENASNLSVYSIPYRMEECMVDA